MRGRSRLLDLLARVRHPRSVPVACLGLVVAALAGICTPGSASTYAQARADAKPWRVFAARVSWTSSGTLTLPANGGVCRARASASGTASFFVATHPFSRTNVGIENPVRFGRDAEKLRRRLPYEQPRLPATVRLVIGTFECDDPAVDYGCSGTYRETVKLRPDWLAGGARSNSRIAWELDAEDPPKPLPPRECLEWDGIAKLFGPLHAGGAVPLSRGQMLRRVAFATSRSASADPYHNGPVAQKSHASFRLVPARP